MGDPGRALLRLLSTPTLGSKRRVWKRYDHMVRTNHLLLPGSDAAVLRLKGSDRMIAFSVDGPSRLVAADAFHGGELAIAESARNVACAGGRPVAFTNGLNFPNPDRPGNLWQFAEVVRGIAAGARKLRTPVVSGNVSFYNEHEAKGILPTPMIGMLGVLEGWRPVPQWFSREGDVIVELGGRAASLNASVYQEDRAGRRGGRPVPVRWPLELAVQKALVASARLGLTRSAHDLAEGGWLVALAECCVSGTDADVKPIGCEVDLPATPGAATWFGEGPSRVIVSLPEEHLRAFARAAGLAPWRRIGRVGGSSLVVRVRGRDAVRLPLADLAAARERPMARTFS
jgi:phosphoribosylformylglycinamidine synthase